MHYTIASLKTQKYNDPIDFITQAAQKAILQLRTNLPNKGGFLIVSPPHGNNRRLTARVFDIDAGGVYIGGVHFFLDNSPATFEPEQDLEPGDGGFNPHHYNPIWRTTTFAVQCLRSDIWKAVDIDFE